MADYNNPNKNHTTYYYEQTREDYMKVFKTNQKFNLVPYIEYNHEMLRDFNGKDQSIEKHDLEKDTIFSQNLFFNFNQNGKEEIQSDTDLERIIQKCCMYDDSKYNLNIDQLVFIYNKWSYINNIKLTRTFFDKMVNDELNYRVTIIYAKENKLYISYIGEIIGDDIKTHRVKDYDEIGQDISEPKLLTRKDIENYDEVIKAYEKKQKNKPKTIKNVIIKAEEYTYELQCSCNAIINRLNWYIQTNIDINFEEIIKKNYTKIIDKLDVYNINEYIANSDIDNHIENAIKIENIYKKLIVNKVTKNKLESDAIWKKKLRKNCKTMCNTLGYWYKKDLINYIINNRKNEIKHAFKILDNIFEEQKKQIDNINTLYEKFKTYVEQNYIVPDIDHKDKIKSWCCWYFYNLFIKKRFESISKNVNTFESENSNYDTNKFHSQCTKIDEIVTKQRLYFNENIYNKISNSQLDKSKPGSELKKQKSLISTIVQNHNNNEEALQKELKKKKNEAKQKLKERKKKRKNKKQTPLLSYKELFF